MTLKKFYNQVALMHTSTDAQCQVSRDVIPCGDIALAVKPDSTNLSNRWVSVEYMSEFVGGLREVVEGGDLQDWGGYEFVVVTDAEIYHSDCIVCEERWSSGEDPKNIVSFHGGCCDSWCHMGCIDDLCGRIESGLESLWSHHQAEIVLQKL